MSAEENALVSGADIAASEANPTLATGAGPDEFSVRFLEPKRVRLFRSPMGAARLEIRDEVCYSRVTVRRIRPLNDPDHYISLWVGDEVEIGLIRDPAALDVESRRILDEELDKRYFTPVIQRIYAVKERFGVHDWDVETTRGRANFSVRGLHQNVRQIPPARLLITDVRGNRYDIPDVAQLDRKSYDLIQRHL